VDGWMEVKAVLRIAYSNQKASLNVTFFSKNYRCLPVAM
jgi:hypothetical protein